MGIIHPMFLWGFSLDYAPSSRGLLRNIPEPSTRRRLEEKNADCPFYICVAVAVVGVDGVIVIVAVAVVGVGDVVVVVFFCCECIDCCSLFVFRC